MATNVKKTFKDKIFYLDVRNYKSHDELQKILKKLGAKIESFLSRDVDYVITDREGAKPKLDIWTPVTPKSIAFDSPSPVHYYDNATSLLFDTPAPTSSPMNDPRRSILSRGLTLVQKATQNTHGSTDLLGVCNQWNIRVIHVQKMLGFLAKWRYALPKKNNKNQMPKENKQVVLLHQETLNFPFIKVEDCKSLYKPQMKAFPKGWRDSIDRGLLRFAESLQSKVRNGIPSNVLRETQSFNIPKPQNNIKSKQNSKVHPSHSKAILVTPKNVPKATVGSNRTKSTRPTQQRRKVLSKQKYCEICSSSFHSLQEHLESKHHKRFQLNPDNFKKIAAIMSTLPTVDDFMVKNACSAGNEITEDVLLSGPVDNTAATFPLPVDDQVTEEYDVANDIISASCSSDNGFVNYPFLENAEDNGKVLGKVPNLFANSDEIPYNTSSRKGINAKSYADAIVAEELKARNQFEMLQQARQVIPEASKQETFWGKMQQKQMNCFESPPTTPALDYTIFLNTNPRTPSIPTESIPTPSFSMTSECKGVTSFQTPQPKETEISTFNSSVLRTFPFTNFGFGWEGSINTFPAHQSINVEGGVPAVLFADENMSEADFEDNCCSEMEEEVRSTIGNLRKSLGSDHETSALDLSVIRPKENNAYPRDLGYLVPEIHMKVGLMC